MQLVHSIAKKHIRLQNWSPMFVDSLWTLPLTPVIVLLDFWTQNPSENTSKVFHPIRVRKVAPNFGRSFGRRLSWNFSWGFGVDFGLKIASDVFPSLGISRAIARSFGWKVYIIITINNAGNHATIFGYNLKTPCFAFEHDVMMQFVLLPKTTFPFKIGPQCFQILHGIYC